ncbi:hypothetical protein BD626DRAFT_584870 [Schizophyllum amplum]|uniref:Ser-Thr-rich glycosyl-phosphatidyl-inositol-anchored membrane family-domain-containing protein n=1 Tax=Schizophyllum amplum TaxID=97359 RepID=A0A550C8H1_9AGAR|nr:hypothetical protein BD626DRAFT_584870 [Auriculariopsis ampla]
MRMLRLALLALQGTLVPLARGALFPTQPIRKTVFYAGNEETVTWVDDGRAPHVDRLGRLKVDLYAANNTFLYTLGHDIDATDGALSVTLPPDLDYSASHYALHFVPQHARYGIIYTADFVIRNAKPSTEVVPFLATATSNVTVPAAVVTFVLPSTTLTSTLVGAASVLPSHATITAPSLQQANIPEEEAQREDDMDDDEDSRNVSSVYRPPTNPLEYNSALRGFGWPSAGPVDWERFKFKLVFIVWPALVGVSMAI